MGGVLRNSQIDRQTAGQAELRNYHADDVICYTLEPSEPQHLLEI